MKQTSSRYINALLCMLLAVTALTGMAWWACRPSQHGLQGAYYRNTTWDDTPFLTVIDPSPSKQSFESHRQHIGAQQPFSVEWAGYLLIPQSGAYTFITASDDGSHLKIDGIQVVDNGGPHGLQERRGGLWLRRGYHQFMVRYFDIGGYAALRVFWQRNDATEPSMIPPQNFIPPISLTRVWIFQRLGLVLPVLGWLWGLTGVSAVGAAWLRLRQPQVARPAPGWWISWSALRALAAATVSRLFAQPVAWAARHLTRPSARYWLLVVAYTSAIFFTLSYARTLTDLLTDRYGDHLFTIITRSALLAVGIAILVYSVRLRDALVSRLIVTAGVGMLYAYVLSAEFRDVIHDLHPLCDAVGAYLESLQIFPILPIEKVHFLEYGLLGWLLCKALSFHIRDKLAYLLAVVGVYIIGLLDEGLQWALPERVGEYRDIALNILAGVLAVMVVWLVLRPAAFRIHARWSSLRPLGYTTAVALVLTGIFLQHAHGFGQLIFLPDAGLEFVSVFSKRRLLAVDNIQRQRLEGQLVPEVSALDVRNFDYEGRTHRYFRDWYRNRNMFWESYCEQEILKTAYRSYLQQHQIALIEYDKAQFAVSPDERQPVSYRSAAQQLAITAFSAPTMWTVISIGAALAALGAGWCPPPVRRQTNLKTPKSAKSS